MWLNQCRSDYDHLAVAVMHITQASAYGELFPVSNDFVKKHSCHKQSKWFRGGFAAETGCGKLNLTVWSSSNTTSNLNTGAQSKQNSIFGATFDEVVQGYNACLPATAEGLRVRATAEDLGLRVLTEPCGN